jgi:hypothetical protein
VFLPSQLLADLSAPHYQPTVSGNAGQEPGAAELIFLLSNYFGLVVLIVFVISNAKTYPFG